MSERNPDASAGIYVALISITTLVCLVGAFVLPGWISLNRWLGVFALVGFFIGIPILDRIAHTSRIREAVEELGGTVIGIKRLSFWKQDGYFRRLPVANKIKFLVDFVGTDGLLHQAHCYSSWFYGVIWLDEVVVKDFAGFAD
jgi:hypothetical protein